MEMLLQVCSPFTYAEERAILGPPTLGFVLFFYVMACSLSGLITYRSSDDSDSPEEIQPQRESDPCEEPHSEEPSTNEGKGDGEEGAGGAGGGGGAGGSEEGEAQEGEPALPRNPASPLGSPYAKRTAYAAELSDLSEQMRRFLCEVKRFFTQKINFERQRPALSASTYGKAQERMLCYLGYLKSVLLDGQITADCFLRLPLIEGYAEFLKDDRHCGPATISNHISSLLYPIKFLHAQDAPDFVNVPIIRQLRAQATILQREGDLERPSTREDLESHNRWLPWEEVVRAVSLQRDRFQLALRPHLKARECCNLVVLSLYVFIPPSRGLEIRTLQIVRDPSSLESRRLGKRNLLILRDQGVALLFDDFKTRKSSGRDELALENGHELCRILRSYVDNHRPRLVTEGSGDFLLLNKNGDRYSGPAFSAHVKSLFHSLTGKLVTVNMLRSAFITWSYGRSDCTDALKSSLAAALRHSQEQAQKTYDRRTANERKGLAVSMARAYAEEILDVEDDPTPAKRLQNSTTQPGDFVAVVQEDSTLQSPKLLLGQVNCITGRQRASLIWYKKISKGLYKLELNGEEWTESLVSLVPVTVKAAKNRPGVFRLADSPRTIHRAAFENETEPSDGIPVNDH